MIANVGSQCGHDCPVESLDLTIHLRMVGLFKRIMDNSNPTDVQEELVQELFAIVGN